MSDDCVEKYKRLAAFSSLITMEKEIAEIERAFLSSEDFNTPELTKLFIECGSKIYSLRCAIVKASKRANE